MDDVVTLREHFAAIRDEMRLEFEMALRAVEQRDLERSTALAERLDMLNGTGHKLIEQRIVAVQQELSEHIQALRRERELVTAAQQVAIQKAEAATEKRFEAANEWRAQSNDRERVHMENLARLTNTYLPRETFQSFVDAWSMWRQDIDQRMSENRGITLANRRSQDRVQPWAIWVAGVGVTFVLATIIFLANILTGQ